MSRRLLFVSVFVGSLAADAAFAQSFEYSLEAPFHLDGEPGSTVSFEALAFLESSGIAGNDGAEAWSVSIAIENATIVGATTAGTAGDVPPDGFRLPFSSFELTEITTGPGNEGVVSAVILSLDDQARTLPATGRVPILRLNVVATVPEPSSGANGIEECAPANVRLKFQDGLSGDGEPVRNVVTLRGQSYPAITSPDDTLTTVCPVLENEATFRVDVLDPEAVRESFHGDRFRWMLSAPPGTSETEVELGLFLASKFDGLGVAGWSASIEIDDAFEILGATVADTAGDLDARGFDGFELTEIVDPNENGGRSGVVSAVILCLSECDTTLPAVGEELVLRVHGTIDTSSIIEEGQELGPIAIQPTESNEIGLEGSGEPVKTVASQSGISVPADVIGAELVVVATTPPIPFIRGEANDDSSRDIGDVVFLLNYLFQNGPELLCEKAADSNDDGTLDLSDSIHLLLFLFRGGLAPTAPFPDCGTDPTPDSLTCFARLGACGP